MDQNAELEKVVAEFMTYEDYLDSLLTKDDLMFLEDRELCREILTLVSGYHSSRRVIPRELFEQRKAERAEKMRQSKVKELRICSSGKVCSEKLMQALAKREEDNLRGCVATIIFLRDFNKRGQEVSAYIDYAHRLKTEDWEPYFKGEKKLMPLKTDLSFYNWTKEVSFHTSSPYFDVVTDVDSLTLTFVCRNDSCVIDVDPKSQLGENVYRQDIFGTNYAQAVLYDHIVDKPIG